MSRPVTEQRKLEAGGRGRGGGGRASQAAQDTRSLAGSGPARCPGVPSLSPPRRGAGPGHRERQGPVSSPGADRRLVPLAWCPRLPLNDRAGNGHLGWPQGGRGADLELGVTCRPCNFTCSGRVSPSLLGEMKPVEAGEGLSSVTWVFRRPAGRLACEPLAWCLQPCGLPPRMGGILVSCGSPQVQGLGPREGCLPVFPGEIAAPRISTLTPDAASPALPEPPRLGRARCCSVLARAHLTAPGTEPGGLGARVWLVHQGRDWPSGVQPGQPASLVPARSASAK